MTVEKISKSRQTFIKNNVFQLSHGIRNIIGSVETWGDGWGDLLPIDNDSEKKKILKKYKLVQIPQKLLATLPLPTSSNV